MSSSAIPAAMKQTVRARANCRFPSMVHQCLFDIEELARRDPKMKNLLAIVSWEKQGQAFRIHDRKGFETLIMPVWFVRLKYNSFLRQLSQFGFKKTYHDSEFARKGGEHVACTSLVVRKHTGKLTETYVAPPQPGIIACSSKIDQHWRRKSESQIETRTGRIRRLP